MKKMLLMAAIASVAFASCVNDEIANPKNQIKNKIKFDNPVLYCNENSRANVTGEIGGGSYPQDENFVIYAVSHENDFAGWAASGTTAAEFNGATVSYDVDVNGWAPKTDDDKYYFWENDKKMSFAACSPADLEQSATRTYGATGLCIEDFKIPAVGEQYDLLFSERQINQTSADMSTHEYSGIPIVFQHALASIRFSIANESEEVVVLKRITVKNVKNKGTFNENVDETDVDTYVIDPAWTDLDGSVSYVAFNGSVEFPDVTQADVTPAFVLDFDKVDGNVAYQLLLMPQDLSNDAIIEVVYTVNDKENTKEVNLKGLKSSKVENGSLVETGTINSWEMGKRYTYQLHYNQKSAAKDKIYFAPTTKEWIDVDNIIVEL